MELIEPITWTIVQFVEDNSVAAVPTKWIRDEECVWPPFPPHKLHTTVKNQINADPHWPLYKVNIFKNAIYDTYEKALRKTKLAEDTSDLAETDDYSQKKKRKIIKKKKISSDSDSDADGNTGITPSQLPPPPTIFPLVSIAPSVEPAESSSDSNDSTPLAVHKQNEVVQIRDLQVAATENSSTSATLFPSPSVIHSSKNAVTPGMRRSNMTEVVTAQAPGTSRDSKCTCCPKHAEVNKEVLRQLYFLRSLTSDIMEEIIKTKRQDTVQPNTESIFIKFNFPLSSEDDLAAFNVYLEEENHFNEAVDEIAKFGGKNTTEYVKRALSALIKNNLATAYSWLGRRDKQSFCNTRIAKLILKSSEKVNNATQKECEVAIQGWLKRAPERAKKD